ncbi:SRPBCC domain-containing protein [Erythrobacter sp. SDW2]|uniref:SRPBCC domain-containing protein n=1 Tax=Erythrobacter sp. SDW2 TaxID=2907154 RepID=UPI001F476864|nr:SRPBCC domain-containing protein [Erythrobacter sp. SDW2]UIP06322.1 SRPBCC domain-containing protein [Erythrobacter sp. SDW2]
MHELSITRFIAAPTDKVWDVMSNRIEEWFCPKPWRAEFANLERRAGGTSDCTMYGPDGEVQPNPGTVIAWDEGRRFAFTDALVGDLEPSGPFMVGIWEVEPATEEGVAGTRYTARARHWTEEACQQHEEMGFTEGWGACADQLKALAEAD